jgi:hypothetical protein
MKYLILLLLFISCGREPLFNAHDPSKNQTRETLSAKESFAWGETHLDFAIKFDKQPRVGEEAKLTIKYWDRTQTNFFGPYEILKDHFCVFLWMKMPDGSEHGSVPAITTQVDTYYKTTDLFFIMNGKWQIRLRTVKDPADCTGFKDAPYIHEEIITLTIN